MLICVVRLLCTHCRYNLYTRYISIGCLHGILCGIKLQKNVYICHMECLKNVFLYIFLVVMTTLKRCSIPDRGLPMYNNVC